MVIHWAIIRGLFMARDAMALRFANEHAGILIRNKLKASRAAYSAAVLSQEKLLRNIQLA